MHIFGTSHPVIIAGCFFNHTSSFIQLVDSAEFGIIAFSALHWVTSHAMLIRTVCGTYIRRAGVSSARHISLDRSGLPEWSYSLETLCQTCLMCDGVSRYAGIFSVVPALPFPRSTHGPGDQIILHFCRIILAPHL